MSSNIYTFIHSSSQCEKQTTFNTSVKDVLKQLFQKLKLNIKFSIS